MSDVVDLVPAIIVEDLAGENGRVRVTVCDVGNLLEPPRIGSRVVVQEDDPCPVGDVDSTIVPPAVSEIRFKGDQSDPVPVTPAQEFDGTVRRAVVDDDRFETSEGLGDHRVKAFFEEIPPVPVEDYDREERFSRGMGRLCLHPGIHTMNASGTHGSSRTCGIASSSAGRYVGAGSAPLIQ